MKYSEYLCALIILTVMLCAGCGGPDAENTGLVKLTENVYALIPESPGIEGGLGANSGFVIGREGVLVIDSRYTPGLAREMLDSIKTVTDLPVKYLVNTHYHPVNTWGNSVFRDEGATIIARPETARDMRLYFPMYLEYYRRHKPESFEQVKDIELALPDSSMGDELKIDLGTVLIELKYFGAAHTAGDCVVSIDGGKVVFAGGLVSIGYHPNLADRGVDYDNWLMTLDSIKDMAPEYIVPADGHICEARELDSIKNYITGLRELCRKMAKEGISIDRAVSSVKVEDFMPEAADYPNDNLLPFNVQTVYQRELLSVINPGFEIDIPDDFVVSGGGGRGREGKVLWTRISANGYEEIEIQWQPTSRQQVIIQDVYDRVSRFSSSTGQKREYRIDKRKEIVLSGQEVPAATGFWVEEREGVGSGGLWTITMIVSKGKLYTIECLESVGGKEGEREALEALEEIISTFRVSSG